MLSFCCDSTMDAGTLVRGCLSASDMDVLQRRRERFICPVCSIRKRIPFHVSQGFLEGVRMTHISWSADVSGKPNTSSTCQEHWLFIVDLSSFGRIQEYPPSRPTEGITEQHIQKRPLGTTGKTGDHLVSCF